MKEIYPSPIMRSQENIDPGFSYPGSEPAVPTPPWIEIDPGMLVPPQPPVYPDYPVPPVPEIPCINCNDGHWGSASVRILNAAAGYNAFTVDIDNQPVYSGLDFAQVTPYRKLSRGYHVFYIMAANGYVYLRKSVYIGDGMTTIAIVNAARGLDLAVISDEDCSTIYGYSCVRVCNLAYYSGSINVNLGRLLFSNVKFRQATGFNSVINGSYGLTVARSARPAVTLVNTTVNLNPNRIYTLYVFNWNQSADTIQTMLVEDRRV